MKRPLVIYDFATAPFWISLYMRKILFSFLSVWTTFVFFLSFSLGSRHKQHKPGWANHTHVDEYVSTFHSC